MTYAKDTLPLPYGSHFQKLVKQKTMNQTKPFGGHDISLRRETVDFITTAGILYSAHNRHNYAYTNVSILSKVSHAAWVVIIRRLSLVFQISPN